jgi:hypothetical protein
MHAARSSRRSSSHDKVQDQRDHRKEEQEVYQTTCYVKHSETTNPSNQQNNEKNRPDAHMFFCSSSIRECLYSTPRNAAFTSVGLAVQTSRCVSHKLLWQFIDTIE